MHNSSNGMILPHRSKLAFVFKMSDGIIIFLVLLVALFARGIAVENQYMLAALLVVICFAFVGSESGLYRSQRGSSLSQQIWPVLVAWGITVSILSALAYFLKSSADYSRVVVGFWFVAAPTLLILWRLTVRSLLSHYRSKGYNTRSVAIVGAGAVGQRIGQVIKDTPSYGLNLKGYFDNRKGDDGRVAKNLAAPILGDFDELIRRAKEGKYYLIYIAISMKGEEHIVKLISELSDTTASVHLVPDFLMYDLLHSRWINLGPVPTVSIYESPFMGLDGWLKRIEDVVLSSLILILIAIPMLFIAAGVKLSSSGPVLFKQRRYGMDGRPIKVWKFRSMTVCDDGDNIVQAKKCDVRITPFGAFLRRTSLDELPQFINVLTGEMSIVGPRPHAVAHNEEYRKLISGYMLRHKVKPGITGWAQVNGWRGETDTLDKMEKRVEYDLHYIRNWSLWWDIKIVFRTIFTGFSGKSAY